MYPVPAPPSTSLHGELPIRAGEEEEEHHEKKPVLKKVKDKVKKLKNAFSKKSHGHGDGDEDDDHHQHGDLDEGDDGFEEDEEMNKDPAVHGVPMYKSSAAGAGTKAQDISGGGGNKGAGDGSRLIMEEFDQNQANPRTDPEMETRIQQNQEFENPSTGGRIGEKEISGGGGGGGEGTKDVGDGLRLTTEKFVGDLPPPRTEAETITGSEQNRAYESPATNVRTADNEMSRGWAEGAEGVDDGLGIIKESVEDPGVPRTDGETDLGIEQSRAYNSPATGATTGANEISTGGQGVERVNVDFGLITDDFVEDPTATVTEAEINTRTEQTRGAQTGANEISGVEGAKGVNDGLGIITKDFVKDQATPRTDDETNERFEGSQVHLSPSTGARSGGEGNDAKDVGDGLGSIPLELVEDPAAPKTEAETNSRTEQIRGGEEVKMSPDLCRSLEAMTVSAQNDRGETELPKSANNSYTDKVSSAASKVYEMVADAGTAVISKVKPVARKDGEAEAVGNQSKGISIKEYITGKLTPGEDEKALSELITEARQNKKNEEVEAPRAEGTGSDEGGRGLGVVGKIRETVTSFLGGGQSSPKSLQTESHRKVAEDKNDLHGRPPDAIYQEEGSNEELPSSYH